MLHAHTEKVADRRESMIATLEQSLEARQAPNRNSAVVASLQQVSKNYDVIKALDGMNLEIRGGELVALLGPNGAGKTTAVKLLLGLAQPNSGSVRVFGADPRNSSNRVRVGAMLQVARVPETLRVGE